VLVRFADKCGKRVCDKMQHPERNLKFLNLFYVKNYILLLRIVYEKLYITCRGRVMELMRFIPLSIKVKYSKQF
jgi:hypothetical protein